MEDEEFNAKTKKEKNAFRKEIATIYEAIAEEAKPLVKEYFDYEIPVAMIEDAGITSTGAVSSGNQLPALLREYREYSTNHKLWDVSDNSISYVINSDNQIVRNEDNKEVVLS